MGDHNDAEDVFAQILATRSAHSPTGFEPRLQAALLNTALRAALEHSGRGTARAAPMNRNSLKPPAWLYAR